MATKHSTQPIIINGFEPVSAIDIECAAYITGEQADAMGTLFRSIARLTEDKEIKGLCEHGALQADLQGNDIDVMRERAVRAGFAGGAA